MSKVTRGAEGGEECPGSSQRKQSVPLIVEETQSAVSGGVDARACEDEVQRGNCSAQFTQAGLPRGGATAQTRQSTTTEAGWCRAEALLAPTPVSRHSRRQTAQESTETKQNGGEEAKPSAAAKCKGGRGPGVLGTGQPERKHNPSQQTWGTKPWLAGAIKTSARPATSVVDCELEVAESRSSVARPNIKQRRRSRQRSVDDGSDSQTRGGRVQPLCCEASKRRWRRRQTVPELPTSERGPSAAPPSRGCKKTTPTIVHDVH